MSQRIEARRIPGTGQIAYREWWGLAWTDWQVVDAPLPEKWAQLEKHMPDPPVGWIPPLPAYEEGSVEVAHRLKIDMHPLRAIMQGTKRFEWRSNDRDYKAGQLLELTCAAAHSSVIVRVLYVMSGGYGLPLGYVVLSIEPVAGRGPWWGLRW